MKYPENHDDPLDGVADWSSDWRGTFDHSEGAHKYVVHRDKYWVLGGKLLDKHSKK
jgi:hypothetical protein